MAFVLTSCEDDEDPFGSVDLTIDFRGEFADRDLEIQSGTYDYPTGEQLVMQLFQYYVSDLALIPVGGGEDVPLSEIELIRYASATDGAITERQFTVPAGEYVGVRFGLGVKPELNAMDPSNFSAIDPLNENEFWNERARYVFAKIEANADLEVDGTFDTGITLHMGSDALYQTVTATSRPFTLSSNEDARLSVVADVLGALGGTTATYDISVPANQTVHGGNQATATGVFNQLARSFTIER